MTKTFLSLALLPGVLAAQILSPILSGVSGASALPGAVWDVVFYTADSSQQLFPNLVGPDGQITRGESAANGSMDFGLDGSGATFNGISQEGIGTSILSIGTNPVTVIAVVRSNTGVTGSATVVLSYGTAADRQKRDMDLLDNGMFVTGQNADATFAGCCASGEWLILAYTYQGGVIKGYRNGVYLGQASVTAWNTVGTSLQIGGSVYLWAGRWSGNIARLVGYNSVLDDAAIATAYQTLKAWATSLPTPIQVYDPASNLARGKSYTAPGAHASYADTGNAQLTNGRFREELYSNVEMTVGWQNANPVVTVDLGTAQSIHTVRTYVGGNGSAYGIGAPTASEVATSTDNSNWTVADTASPADVEGYITQTFTPVVARYVRVTLTRRAQWTAVGEVEVY